jgi:transmembrane sensor
MSSDGDEIRAADKDAKAVRTKAAEWVLARRLTETWNEADQAALDNWLEESLVNRLAYLRLEATWLRTRRLAALRSSSDDGNNPPATRRNRSFLIRITTASIVIAVAVAATATVYLLRPGMKTYTTAIGNHATVTLADGSTIELNTDTVVRVSNDQNRRTATLEKGEAYFHIKHDFLHPFAVRAAGHVITDLGTEFTVRRGTNGLTVALLEGRARFDSAGIWPNSQGTVLTPGDVVKTAGNSVFIARHPVAKLKTELAWRSGVLVFENATLTDAAQELNRYNSQKIVIADDAVGRLRFDASIRTDGVRVFTRVARQVFGLRVETRGNEVVISR